MCRIGIVAVLVVASLLGIAAAHALPSTPTTQQIFFPDSDSRFVCAEHGGVWMFGMYTAKRGTFRPFAEEMQIFKRKIAAASSTKKTKLKQDMKRFKKAEAQHRGACSVGPDSGATPTPTPRPTATPRPSATPAPGCFDGAGNTTCFSIPAGLVGNRERGRLIWQSDCSGCHSVEWLGRSYTQVNTAFATILEMAPFEPIAQDKADIVAYLNRLAGNPGL